MRGNRTIVFSNAASILGSALAQSIPLDTRSKVVRPCRGDARASGWRSRRGDILAQNHILAQCSARWQSPLARGLAHPQTVFATKPSLPGVGGNLAVVHVAGFTWTGWQTSVEYALWGTDSIWYGIPQSQIDAFRRFEIPEVLGKSLGTRRSPGQ